MTTGGTSPAAAGWHPDPWGQAQLRWHDGVQWTTHVHGAATRAQPSPTIDVQTLLADPQAWSPYPGAGTVTPPHADVPTDGGFFSMLFIGSARAAVTGYNEVLDEFARRGFSATQPGAPPPGKFGSPYTRPALGPDAWPASLGTHLRAVWRATGVPWGAAGAAVLTITHVGPNLLDSEPTDNHVVLAIPLPAAVAARYPGVIVRPTWEARIAAIPKGVRIAMTLVGGAERKRRIGGPLSRWQAVDLGSIEASRRWELHRSAQQGEVEVFELFSTVFVDTLASTLDRAGEFGNACWAVADGLLVVWVQQGTNAGVGRAALEPQIRAVDRLVDVARTVHRRVLEEWR